MDTGVSEIQIVVTPHPLKMDTIEARVPAGQTIFEIIGGKADLPAIIWADGELVEREQWESISPKKHLLISRVPANRDALRLVGFVGVAILSAYTGGATAGLGAAWSGAIQAGVGIAGVLAVNALIPPVLPNVAGTGGQQSLAAITGQSNQVAPFSPIPKVYGNPTYYPPIPMTAQPFTELVGQDQYLRMLLVLGYGPLRIGGVTVGAGHAIVDENTSLSGTPIKIGGTSIDQFEDVEFEIGDPDDVTLYTNTVVETAVGVAINRAADPTSENDLVTDNVQSTQTTATDTDEVVIELFFPLLFTVSGQGNTRVCQVNFEIHRSPVGAGTWTLARTFSVSSNERKPIRHGVHFRVPLPGQYDIRITRVSTFYAQENDFYSDCTWTVIRSIKRNVQAFNVDNTVVMALRIRATDQLGGRIDRLSVSATGVVAAYIGSSWVDIPTSNPAWIYADILIGNATRTPQGTAKLDQPALSAWATFCDTHDLEFDAVIDAEGTVFDRAREVASMGMASWHVTDESLFSIILDEATTPKMIVTPRNSFGFNSDYQFYKIPHALRVQFIDPDTWEPTEWVVYDDGYNSGNATRYEQLSTVGVTTSDHAWRFGRYHLAQLRLRPETFSWGQDIQNLAFTRGDTVEIAQDVILVGLKWGRITAVNSTTEIEVDEFLYMDAATYALKIQKQDGSIVTQVIVTDSPGAQTITFTAPVSSLNVGDHFTFGESGSETLSARITSIEPQGDFKANIRAVPSAPDILDAWDGTIPTYTPVITEPINIALLPPVLPVIVEVTTESPPSPSGAPRLRMAIAFNMPPGLEGTFIEARTRTLELLATASPSVLTYSAWVIAAVAPSTAGVVYVPEVEELMLYEVQIRARRGDKISAWTATVQHLVADSGWLSEAGATNGATAGLNLHNEALALLDDIDIRNDQAVTEALGGFLNANASMQQSRVNTYGNLCPASWFGSDHPGDQFGYVDNATRDVMKLVFSNRFTVNSAFPVDTGFSYQVICVARLASGSSSSADVRVTELFSDLPREFKAFSGFTGVSPYLGEHQVGEGDAIQTVILNMSMTTTWAVYTGIYRPDPNTIWACLEFNSGSVNGVEVELCGIRQILSSEIQSLNSAKLIAASDHNDIGYFTNVSPTVLEIAYNSLGSNGRKYTAIRGTGAGAITIQTVGSPTPALVYNAGSLVIADGGSVVITQISEAIFQIEGNLV